MTFISVSESTLFVETESKRTMNTLTKLNTTMRYLKWQDQMFFITTNYEMTNVNDIRTEWAIVFFGKVRVWEAKTTIFEVLVIKCCVHTRGPKIQICAGITHKLRHGMEKKFELCTSLVTQTTTEALFLQDCKAVFILLLFILYYWIRK